MHNITIDGMEMFPIDRTYLDREGGKSIFFYSYRKGIQHRIKCKIHIPVSFENFLVSKNKTLNNITVLKEGQALERGIIDAKKERKESILVPCVIS